MRQERIKWVQCARGLTISLVVLGHMFFGVRDAVGMDPTTFAYWNSTLAMFRMPMFFLVAGIFAYRALQRPNDAILNRTIMQLLWVYLLWSVAHYAIKASTAGVGNRGMDPMAIFLIGFQPIDVMWFIYVLMLFYGLTWLLRRFPAIAVLPLAAVISVMEYDPSPSWIERATDTYVFFAMGYLGSHWVIEAGAKVRSWHAAVLVPAFAAVALTIVGMGWKDIPTLWFVGGLLGVTAMSTLCVAVADTRAGGLLRFLGDYSLPIFVLHTIVGPTTRVLLVKSGVTDDPAVLVPVCTAIAIAVPVAVAVVADRVGMWWLFKKPGWFAVPLRTGREEDAPAHAVREGSRG